MALSEVWNPPEDLRQSTWEMFEDGAHKDLDAAALTACHQAPGHYSNLLAIQNKDRSHACLRWTYRELRHASLVVAKAMHDAGVKRGSTIMAPISNGIETHLVRIVSFILQLTLVALDADLTLPGRRESLIFYIKTTSPQIILVPDDSSVDAVDEAAREIDFAFDFKFTTGDSLASGWSSWANIDFHRFSDESLERLAGQQQPSLDEDGNRIALVLFTSGTSTGKPKGVPQTVRNVVSAAHNQMWIAELPSTYALQSPHSRAIYACMGFMALAAGHHIVQSHSHFVPEKVYEAVEKYNVELLLLVPAQVKIIAAKRSLDWRKLKSLHRIVLGGDIITTDLMQKAEVCFPQAKITTVWGMSEGTGMVGLRGLDITSPLRTYHSIVTVGKAARSARIRIADSDGKPLHRGESGELLVSGPAMVDHYISNIQPELFLHDSEGTWIRTGDKAVMDEDDYIFMIGRIKDIIKQSGINVSPGVLEATLNKHEGVNAAVLGVPDPIRGEVPVAVNPGVVSEERRRNMKAIVTESLGQDYALKEVYGLADLEMKDFPYNPQGKLQKFKLKDAILRLESRRATESDGHFRGIFYPWFV